MGADLRVDGSFPGGGALLGGGAVGVGGVGAEVLGTSAEVGLNVGGGNAVHLEGGDAVVGDVDVEGVDRVMELVKLNGGDDSLRLVGAVV